MSGAWRSCLRSRAFLRIHMMGPTDEPEDWASAMSEVIEAVKFYEGRQLPERVRRALSAARTGAELSPYFEWLSQEGRVDPMTTLTA